MAAYNFKAQFADAVRSGEKRQTIRETKKRPAPMIGDELQLYTGQRTSKCELLRREKCKNVVEILILPDEKIALLKKNLDGWGLINGIERFARDDGFSSADAFFSFFRCANRPVFKGGLIMW